METAERERALGKMDCNRHIKYLITILSNDNYKTSCICTIQPNGKYLFYSNAFTDIYFVDHRDFKYQFKKLFGNIYTIHYRRFK